MKTPRIQQNKGSVMIIAVLFFLVIALIFVIGITTPVTNQVKSSEEHFLAQKSYIDADSSLEDTMYRIKNNKTVDDSQEIALNGGTTTITVVTSGSQRTVTAVSQVNSFIRKVQSTLLLGSGVAFNYGLQAGNGGMNIGGGSTINGNVYSNGDVDAISATINGSAVAADSAALTADQTNDAPTTPTGSVTFGNAAATQDFAQSFQMSTSSALNKIQVYIKKVGTPGSPTIRIVADNNGSPSTTVINTGTMTLTSSLVTTSYGWIEVVAPNTPALLPGTTYWLVLDMSTQNASNYYIIGANNAYANGTAKTGAYSSSWTTLAQDGYFRIYTGGISSLIGGATYAGGVQIGTGGKGDAWASVVKGANVDGGLYCSTGQNNNKTCNTSRGSPPPQNLPYSEANMQDWKDSAAAGGVTNGNVTVGWQGATMGPQKIVGNLTVNGGGTLTLNGPLWITGNLTLTSGGKIQLPANYALNSETIILDGIASINGGGSLGSGQSGSYLFIVSTSKCPNDVGCSGNNAISVTGGAGAIAVSAQYGTVGLSGGTTLKAVVGNNITVTGGSTINYDQGLASPSFSNGPSGGWNVTSWQELTQ